MGLFKKKKKEEECVICGKLTMSKMTFSFPVLGTFWGMKRPLCGDCYKSYYLWTIEQPEKMLGELVKVVKEFKKNGLSKTQKDERR